MRTESNAKSNDDVEEEDEEEEKKDNGACVTTYCIDTRYKTAITTVILVVATTSVPVEANGVLSPRTHRIEFNTKTNLVLVIFLTLW